MIDNLSMLLKVYLTAIPLIVLIGVYCIVVTHNLIRVLIGVEILTKAVTLLLIIAGYVTNNTAFAQSLIITLIVVEAVVVATAAGVILNVFKNNNSLHVRNIKHLRG
ncbi:MAG: NADH-quinone oxidoreductase subunit K [Elusimicrobia bacterium]|nr:NADH-quinone oxidoreductase subunit K [Elusimicrobiota bacterium]